MFKKLKIFLEEKNLFILMLDLKPKLAILDI